MDSYWRQYSDQYKHGQFETILVGIRRKQVLSSLQKYSHRNILEIGCGLEPLFEHVDDFCSYTIVEPSPDFVQAAAERARNRDNVRVIQGFIEEVGENLLAPDFDFIVLSSLLHEVPDPAGLLSLVHKLCRSSTIVHVNVPNVFSFHRLLAYEAGLIESVFDESKMEMQFGRHTRFDKSSLIRLVESQGFRVLAFGTYFVKPFTHEQMEKLLDWRILDQSVIQGLERMISYMPDMGCEMFVELTKRE